MKRRFVFSWRWGKDERYVKLVGDLSGCWALAVNNDIMLHPSLRRAKAHNLLWTTLGHELVHLIYRHSGTAVQERKARHLEVRTGMILHDLYHHLVMFGVKCSPRYCGAKKS